MNTKIFTSLPQDAKDIRIEVFMNEQGFENEFDEIDTISHHIVVFDEGKPIGTCRFFKENNHYTIGRVAVLKEYRNQHIGNLLIRTAEKEIKKLKEQKERLMKVYVNGILHEEDFAKDYEFIEKKLAELENKKIECENLLIYFVEAEAPDGTLTKDFRIIREIYFASGQEFSKLLKNAINSQLESLLRKSNI